MPDDGPDIQAAHSRMILALARLGIHSGIVSSIEDRWPLYARENFVELLDRTTEWATLETEAFHDFAQAFDGQTPGD